MKHARKKVEGGYIYRGYFIRRCQFGQWWVEVDGKPVTGSPYFDLLRHATMIIDHWWDQHIAEKQRSMAAVAKSRASELLTVAVALLDLHGWEPGSVWGDEERALFYGCVETVNTIRGGES